jgi:pimeloyl-ACP methyl ester carboxylesterase
MDWVKERVEWEADGKPVVIGLTRFGTGPSLLILPALSSILTRTEMRPLQNRLGTYFSTVATDWPGFGDLPRPKVDWRPDLYRAFLHFVLTEVVRPAFTVAAGHAAGYALAEAADNPSSTGRLCLLSPTWRGPLPTITGKRMALFHGLAKAVDLPLLGSALYRLNVNGPVIGMMARGHVYADPAWLTPQRLAAKRAVTEVPGARHASFRFVAGELDLFTDREAFLDTVRRIGTDILVAYGSQTPRKSKAEMEALGSLANVNAVELPRGKLSFYEEFPDETAEAIIRFLGAGA